MPKAAGGRSPISMFIFVLNVGLSDLGEKCLLPDPRFVSSNLAEMIRILNKLKISDMQSFGFHIIHLNESFFHEKRLGKGKSSILESSTQFPTSA